jgi:hypothetical protein
MSAPTIRVVSWQQSGVAWAPWRVRRCLRSRPASTVEMSVTASHRELESYGLPDVDDVVPVEMAAAGADVLHLHHAYASSELIPALRERFPKLRIVVTLHGEPDRSMGLGCQHAPDAYHIVEPGLASLCTNAPATLIPNHPATIDGFGVRRHDRRKPPRLLIPFSHVAQHKDHDVAEVVAERLTAAGWIVTWLRQRVTNASLLECIEAHDACWVQLKGYLDILTMECWSIGCLPVVLNPGSDRYRPLARALGFGPVLPFRSTAPNDIADRLLDARTWDTVPVNRAGMRACWTAEFVSAKWERFYAGVASGAAQGSR